MKSFDAVETLGNGELSAGLERLKLELNSVAVESNAYFKQPVGDLVKKGKKLRPALLFAVVLGQDKKLTDETIKSAAAIELLHLASLVHDDIIDETDNRWHASTLHDKAGTAQALLVGDYLLARANHLASQVNESVASLIAQTFTDLCAGQGVEQADKFNLKRTKRAYIESIKLKTGSLLSTACEIGAICAGLNHQQTRQFANFGENFGIAFQLLDDLLDFLSTSQLAGKSVGHDARDGVYTLPVILSIGSKYASEVRRWVKNPKAKPHSLNEILFKSGSAQMTVEEIKSYNQKAAHSLKSLDSKTANAKLAKFPEVYTEWSLNNLVSKDYQKVLNEVL